MDWESEGTEKVSEKKDTSKRIWYGIFIIIIVSLGALYIKEDKKDVRQQGVHVRHILIGFEAHDAELRKKSLEVVKDVKRQLEEGASFSKLAAEYSTDPQTKSLGGELGWFKKGATAQEFDDYIWKGPVGEYSAPIETKFGFHIIHIIERNFSNNEEYQQDINRRLNEMNKNK